MITFLSVIITAVCYLAFPIYYRQTHDLTPRKKAGKIALINSIIVGLIFTIISISVLDTSSTGFSSAFIYYFIAKAIIKNEDDTDEQNDIDDKDNTL